MNSYFPLSPSERILKYVNSFDCIYWVNQVTSAASLAYKHFSQSFRRDGKTPYITHIDKTVSFIRVYQFVDPVIEKYKFFLETIAYLHDSVEDGKTTFEQLAEEGTDLEVIDILKILTHTPKVGYSDYILEIKKNREATIVKIADLLANISDSPTHRQLNKYYSALLILSSNETQISDNHG